MSEKPKAQNPPSSPYIGLMPFAEKDADYFFGRATDIENVATNLRAASLTIFYGGSGVGKSSLLNAGVLPYLQKIATHSILPGEPPEFLLVVVREWVNNPMDILRLCIKDAVEKAVKGKKIPNLAMVEVENIARDNKQNNDLCSLLKIWTDLIKTDLLIIFDQFEDFFLHPDFAVGNGTFGEEFPKAVNDKELPVNFMLSLRDDAIAKLDFFQGKIPNLMENTLRLLPLDRDATAEAICNPLIKYNEKMETSFTIEKDLVEKLLNDLQVDNVKFDTQGQAAVNPVDAATSESSELNKCYRVETPYLQLVMMRLWKDENTQRDQSFTLDTLKEKLGGVQKIVETHLDEVIDQFSDEDKELAAEFIHFTVTRSGSKIPADANDLAEWADLPDRKEDIERILRQLSSGETRIFKVVPNRRNPKNPFYEVAHDALGPAILSWRKRVHETNLQELARRKEEEKSRREVERLEAVRQAESDVQQQETKAQAAKLKAEQEKRENQEKILAAERKSRKYGRIAFVIGIFAMMVSAVLGFIYFVSRNNMELSNKNTQLAVEANKVNDVSNKAEKQTEVENVNIENLNKRINQCETVIDILSGLQSGNSARVEKVLKQLRKLDINNDVPKEYKPLMLNILNKNKIVPKEAEQQGDVQKKEKPVSETPTIIFIHIQKPDPNAEKLKKLLQKNDYLAPGIENVGEQPSIREVQLRYFRSTDADFAEEIQKFLQKHNITAKPTLIGGYENSPLVRPNQFELWFTGDSIPNITD